MKKWIEKSVKNLVPLDYIIFTDVPMKKSKYGDILDMDSSLLESMAAKAIIQQRIPLRGREVKFLRKTLGFSMEKFAAKLELTSGTIFHWEKAEQERLAAVNELAVRSFVAEQLEIEISGKFSELLGDKIRSIELAAS